MNEVLGAGLLLAVTIGIFIAAVIPPIANVLGWIEHKPARNHTNIQDLLDWINSGLDKIFGNENGNQTAEPG
ncbi:MAG TPA: hypothetical protein ENF87_02200 [Thermoproteales archaeon]|nr:hypothetical protein [Thermoproteales archaeon]